MLYFVSHVSPQKGLHGVRELRQSDCAITAGEQLGCLQIVPQLVRLLRELDSGPVGEHRSTFLCGELAKKQLRGGLFGDPRSDAAAW